MIHLPTCSEKHKSDRSINIVILHEGKAGISFNPSLQIDPDVITIFFEYVGRVLVC